MSEPTTVEAARTSRAIAARVLLRARHFRRPWWSAAGAALAAALWAAPGVALEWRSTPAVAMSTGYDDNIYLEPIHERAVANASVTASADIAARDESFSFNFQPQVRALRYDGELADDRNDTFATLSAAWARERQEWSLGARYAHESTLTSGFEDTGVLLSDIDRMESVLNAGWSRRTGERGKYNLGASSTRARYGDTVLGYTDYDYEVIQAGYTLSTGTRSSWRFGASQSVVHVLDSGVENRSTSVSATWNHVFSPELTVSLGLGVFDQSSERPAALLDGEELEGGDPTPSLDFSVERRWERWTLDARGSRELRPDGRGRLVREDSVQVDFDRRITQRLTVGASLLAARTTDTFLPGDLASRDYAQTGVHARMSVGQRWSVSCSVDERAQEAWWWPRSSGVVSQIAASYRGR